MPTSVLRRTISQLFMVGIPGPTLDADTRRFLTERPPGGVILFKRNVHSASQLRHLIADLHALGPGVSPLVGIDHEGGRVDRFRMRPFTPFPAAAVVAAAKSVRLAEAVGEAMGRELAAIGIDIDFAPVLDVWANPRNEVIGDRAYGTTAAQVARFGVAVARGLERGGVLPCGKHFPGHGRTLGDSHKVLPRVSASRRALTTVEIPPFVRAIRAGIPALMSAHVVYPALDPKHPATLSPAIATSLLRRRLGFTGVLFSDDLEMQAVAGRAAPERLAPEALAAGCDMLLVCQSLDVAERAMTGVEQAIASGALAPRRVTEAVGRIHDLRRRVPARQPSPRLGWPAHTRLARRLQLSAVR
ncbi:MAG TPA: beta-N-acetylhexosaminidase [Candidatus Eisenbacteria bacterium]|nr:beta-N-acetylhexosaminidase [Candidatus Eisenbacteria bacterium]